MMSTGPPYYRRLVEKECQYCGKRSALPLRNKYCDFECMGLARRTVRETKPCEGCKKPFAPLPGRDESQRFCSRACWIETRRVDRSDPKVGTCIECGNAFQRPNRSFEYCDPCRRVSWGRLLFKNRCVICDKVFRPKLKEQECCSQTCRGARTAVHPRLNCKLCGRSCPRRGSPFCSATCYRQDQAEEKLRRKPACQICGKPVKGRKITKFCSRACMGISHCKYGSDEEREEARRAAGRAYSRKMGTVEYHMQKPNKGEREWLAIGRLELRAVRNLLKGKTADTKSDKRKEPPPTAEPSLRASASPKKGSTPRSNSPP